MLSGLRFKQRGGEDYLCSPTKLVIVSTLSYRARMVGTGRRFARPRIVKAHNGAVQARQELVANKLPRFAAFDKIRRRLVLA